MPKCRDHQFLKGALAGMIGGLVASWTMNKFQAGLSRVAEAWDKSAHRNEAPKPRSSSDQAATAILAQRLSRAAMGRELSEDEMKIAEPVVHYAFGTLAGGVYGLLAELTPAATKALGCGYATALWLAGDEIAVPMLRLSKSPANYPAKVHLEAFASHLVYGISTEEVRRGVRALI
jgi:uncharacterized membrane protein YagU involved in acid resistance